MELKNDTKSLKQEIDTIYSLLTYALVYKYWNPLDRGGRGYNVGCILVDSNNIVQDYGINHVCELDNATQHGEVRLITTYLNKRGIYNLEDHTVYSTLEPCAMCGGMMTMVSIKRTVNGQPDYFFSKALERLSFNSESIGGYSPYPRTVISETTPSKYASILDSHYKAYIEEGNKPILTKFLTTEVARKIYESATEEFLEYVPEYPDNNNIYAHAKDFYLNLSNEPK